LLDCILALFSQPANASETGTALTLIGRNALVLRFHLFWTIARSGAIAGGVWHPPEKEVTDEGKERQLVVCHLATRSLSNNQWMERTLWAI
jgi:hypothetical protein